MRHGTATRSAVAALNSRIMKRRCVHVAALRPMDGTRRSWQYGNSITVSKQWQLVFARSISGNSPTWLPKTAQRFACCSRSSEHCLNPLSLFRPAPRPMAKPPRNHEFADAVAWEAGSELGTSAFDPPGADELEAFTLVRADIEARVEKLRRKLKGMGSVNSESLESLEELEGRYTALSTQLNDLVEAKRMLEDVIRRINVEGRKLFAETFTEIQKHFRELFRKLFGGGEGDIILEDPTDVLESGIDLIARPPGKELRSLSLLSGGEKAMVCVALLLAIFRSKPSPFCLLDEVDAPLDEANIGRFVTVLKEFKQSTQFIMITHRKPSMCEADVLYGVTMEQAGVSKRLNVRFEDVADDGSFKQAKQAA